MSDTTSHCPANAVAWFEIGCRNLAQSQAFFEAVTTRPMRREAMGPSEGAVFAYAGEGAGVGGAIMCGPTAPTPGAGGVLVYLNCDTSLDAALARALAAGGRVLLPRQTLPQGMGFFAHVQDLDGNRIGLHSAIA